MISDRLTPRQYEFPARRCCCDARCRGLERDGRAFAADRPGAECRSHEHGWLLALCSRRPPIEVVPASPDPSLLAGAGCSRALPDKAPAGQARAILFVKSLSRSLTTFIVLTGKGFFTEMLAVQPQAPPAMIKSELVQRIALTTRICISVTSRRSSTRSWTKSLPQWHGETA